MPRLSMRELARKLGVDRATISRALSEDKAHLVAPSTRERIRAEALIAGYRPDQMAAALRRGRSQTVGILVSDLLNEVLVRVVRDIVAQLNDSAAAGSAITPLIAETREDTGVTRHLLRTFLSRRVDAVVSLASTEADVEALLEAAAEVPVVLAVRSIAAAAFPSAVCDDEAGGAMVAAYFASRGHQRVCQLKGPQLAATFKNRSLGFTRVAAQAGLTETPADIEALAATSLDGKRALPAILAAPARPTAVFAHNDALALGLIEAMRERGLRYPADLAIVGFNNTELSRVLALPLTTVDYPVAEVSRYAGDLVRALIGDRNYAWETKAFRPALIVRASA